MAYIPGNSFSPAWCVGGGEAVCIVHGVPLTALRISPSHGGCRLDIYRRYRRQQNLVLNPSSQMSRKFACLWRPRWPPIKVLNHYEWGLPDACFPSGPLYTSSQIYDNSGYTKMTNQIERVDGVHPRHSNPLIHEFKSYVDNVLLTHSGMNGLGIDHKTYICRQMLKEYWDPRWKPKSVRDMLDNEEGCGHITVSQITGDYLRIFSILCYISTDSSSAVRYIRYFIDVDYSDIRLPLIRNGSKWPHNKYPRMPRHREFLDALTQFLEHQWTFIPFELTQKSPIRKSLDPNIILPFDSGSIRPLKNSAGAQSEIQLVSLQKCCTTLNMVSCNVPYCELFETEV